MDHLDNVAKRVGVRLQPFLKLDDEQLVVTSLRVDGRLASVDRSISTGKKTESDLEKLCVAFRAPTLDRIHLSPLSSSIANENKGTFGLSLILDGTRYYCDT